MTNVYSFWNVLLKYRNRFQMSDSMWPTITLRFHWARLRCALAAILGSDSSESGRYNALLLARKRWQLSCSHWCSLHPQLHACSLTYVQRNFWKCRKSQSEAGTTKRIMDHLWKIWVLTFSRNSHFNHKFMTFYSEFWEITSKYEFKIRIHREKVIILRKKYEFWH